MRAACVWRRNAQQLNSVVGHQIESETVAARRQDSLPKLNLHVRFIKILVETALNAIHFQALDSSLIL